MSKRPSSETTTGEDQKVNKAPRFPEAAQLADIFYNDGMVVRDNVKYSVLLPVIHGQAYLVHPSHADGQVYTALVG